MVIFKCDICGKEITGQQEFGNFEIQEKVIEFVKHQKQDQLRKQKFLFCIECARKVKDYFQGLDRVV